MILSYENAIIIGSNDLHYQTNGLGSREPRFQATARTVAHPDKSRESPREWGGAAFVWNISPSRLIMLGT